MLNTAKKIVMTSKKYAIFWHGWVINVPLHKKHEIHKSRNAVIKSHCFPLTKLSCTKMFPKFKTQIIVLYCYSWPTGICYGYKVIVFPISHGLKWIFKSMHNIGEIRHYELEKHNFDNKQSMKWLTFEWVIYKLMWTHNTKTDLENFTIIGSKN